MAKQWLVALATVVGLGQPKAHELKLEPKTLNVQSSGIPLCQKLASFMGLATQLSQMALWPALQKKLCMNAIIA